MHRNLLHISPILFLLIISLLAVPKVSSQAETPTGIIIPLYTSPTDSTWYTTLSVHATYPSVPMIAIVNPDNGVGTSPNVDYINGINNLQSHTITVTGYVSTQYSLVPLSTAQTQIYNWWNWYHVNGIFLDEMSNTIGHELYYTSLTTYAKSLGMTIVIGNAGTSTPSSYTGTVDVIVNYESSGYPSLNYLASYQNKSQWAYIIICSSLDTTYESQSSQYVAWLYITNDCGGNPYDTLPPYFSTEVQTLSPSSPPVTSTTSSSSTSSSPTSTSYVTSTITSTMTSTQIVTSTSYVTSTATATQTVTSTQVVTSTTTVSSTISSSSVSASITIQSVNQFNSPISGFYTILSNNVNITQRSDFTPVTYSTLTYGNIYLVQVDSYSTCLFNHWQDAPISSINYKSGLRAFQVISTPQTFTAVYNC